jgi:hypothetical protein
MRVGRSFVAALVMASALIAMPTVHAAPPVGPGGDPPPPPQPGPITVQYRNGSGGLSSTTSIPVGSAFRSAGGSDRAPCTFMYLGLDPDGDGPLQPIYEPRESLQWMFRETTDTVVELTAEEWAAVAELGGTDVASVFATYGRVESAYRRFDVYCVGTQGSGTTTNSLVTSTLVSIRDVFWDPYARIGTLWTGLQLDRPVALTVPDSGLFGGLPVNMPATLQIDAPPWRTYVSAPSTYRGWTSRLVLSPASLVFDLSFDPDDGPATLVTVDCLEGSLDQPDAGAIPRRSSDVPDFAEPGQYDAPCVWIPPEPGELTVTARITYDVVFTVSGFADVLAPYVWSSSPLTVRVDELSVVNTRTGN